MLGQDRLSPLTKNYLHDMVLCWAVKTILFKLPHLVSALVVLQVTAPSIRVVQVLEHFFTRWRFRQATAQRDVIFNTILISGDSLLVTWMLQTRWHLINSWMTSIVVKFLTYYIIASGLFRGKTLRGPACRLQLQVTVDSLLLLSPSLMIFICKLVKFVLFWTSLMSVIVSGQ